MPLWQQAVVAFVATTATFNLMYWGLWRHYLPGGKYDTDTPTITELLRRQR